MSGQTYDPVILVNDVLRGLRGAGIYPPVRTRDVPAALTAARDLLAALDVPTAAPRPAPAHWLVAYRMTLVDTAAAVVVERALAADQTEIGRVAAGWPPVVAGRCRIDIEPVRAAAQPVEGGLAT